MRVNVVSEVNNLLLFEVDVRFVWELLILDDVRFCYEMV